ncbi:hypothetical protein, partial [Paenibacillus dakarensis]|uniref:hypothetical protein n=1 Tax=Paenibacillus dakarensis TaxID=1527293 RepID=UPI001BA8B3F2
RQARRWIRDGSRKIPTHFFEAKSTCSLLISSCSRGYNPSLKEVTGRYRDFNHIIGNSDSNLDARFNAGRPLPIILLTGRSKKFAIF